MIMQLLGFQNRPSSGILLHSRASRTAAPYGVLRVWRMKALTAKLHLCTFVPDTDQPPFLIRIPGRSAELLPKIGRPNSSVNLLPAFRNTLEHRVPHRPTVCCEFGE